jgi:CelD/BcsL family acetyltransferase involved in cellulose biosynthesis
MHAPVTVDVSAEPPADWADLARRLGGFYHDPAWVVALRETYRFRLHCVSARAGGKLAGLLALMEVPRVAGAPRLVSLPFSYAAGPLAEDLPVSHALLERAGALARERRAHRLEIKMRAPAGPPLGGFERVLRYHTYRIPLAAGEESVWGKLHAESTRRSIKKGLREGATVERAEGEDSWTEMATVNERTAHRHGTPAPPRRFFVEACRTLQSAGRADLYLARAPDGALLGGIVVYQGPAEWIYAFGANDPSMSRYRATHLLLWRAIKDAIAAGIQVFDLGRASPDQMGLVEFKRRWGGEPTPLAYDYWPRAGGLHAESRAHGSLALAAKLWRLLPSPLARAGSFLYRYLG